MDNQGCFDGSCDIRDRRGGQHTNGGCKCLIDLDFEKRQAVRRYIYQLRQERDALKAELTKLKENENV